MTLHGRLVAAIFMALGFTLPALAQTDAPPPPPAPPASVQEAPYEQQLLRLSEILGAIHYLRQLCNSGEGATWRDQMQALIDAESPSPIRRARFVDRFNHGYESYRSVYRTCTPAATLAIDRYMEEGARITRDVTARYGNQG